MSKYFLQDLSFFTVIKKHSRTVNKVWTMGRSSSFSFSKVFFLLMVLMVSSPSLSNNSPSNDSPSPREPKNRDESFNQVKNLVVLVCLSTSPSSTAKNSVIVINTYNDRTTGQSKCVSGCNIPPDVKFKLGKKAIETQ